MNKNISLDDEDSFDTISKAIGAAIDVLDQHFDPEVFDHRFSNALFDVIEQHLAKYY